MHLDEAFAVGSLLWWGPEAFRVCRRQSIDADAFLDPLAVACWTAAAKLEGGGEVWNGDTLFQAVADAVGIDALAGMAEAMNKATTIAFLEYHVQALLEARWKRQMLLALAAMGEAVKTGDVGAAYAHLDEVYRSGGRRAGLTWKTAGEILDEHRPPQSYFIYPWLSPGTLSAVVGQPGAGKTRFVLYALASMIAGRRKVGSMDIPRRDGGGPWLIVGGNENSQQRYDADLKELLRVFPYAEEEIRNRLVFHVYNPGDTMLDADALHLVFEKVREVGNVEGVVFDPPSDVKPPGESLNDDSTMKELCVRLRDGIRRMAPEACVLLIHHAAGGRENAGRAVDPFESGEVGRNSKMLAATARCVLNLVPYDGEGGIVCAFGKLNDAKRPVPFAMRKVQDAGYELEIDFDVESWVEGLKDKRGGGGAAGRPGKSASDGSELLPCFEEDEGCVPAGEVEARAKGRGISRATCYRLLRHLLEGGRIVKEAGGYRLAREGA